MNVTVENVAACRKKLNIEISAEEVAREWTGATAEIRKYAQIPGFRVGRAPVPMLERRFQKEISDEVQRKLIPQSFREAIAKEKLRVVGAPSVEEIKFARNEPLRFHATVDVAPEFQLPSYQELKVKKPKVSLGSKEVDEALQLLAEQQADFAEIQDRNLQMGDFAVIAYSGVSEGKPIAEFCDAAKPLSENSQFWILMSKDSFLPGFCDDLVGARIGEKRQVLVDFPKDFRIKELAGKKATYFVEVLKIREKKLPALDDAFAKSYQAASLAELRQRIQENLLKKREHEADASVRNQIVEQLLKAAPFDIPENLVTEETRSSVLEMVRENQIRGVSEDILREKSREILDVAQQNARDKVRASFILARIAEQEKLAVKPEELQEQINLIAQRGGKSAKALALEMEEQGETDVLREQILIRQTLDLLVARAIVETEA